MPEMLKDLEEQKRKILDFTKRVEASPFIDPITIKNSDMKELVHKVESERYKIAMVSTFSAGKSTFINALLGVELLAMDDLAWTATVTRVVYSEQIYITVKYKDKRKDEHFTGTYEGQEISTNNLDVLRKILEMKTTVKANGEELNVKEVIIGYPFELCKNGIEFIDTPGLGATHESHDQITNSILPDVQAVIFLFSHLTINDNAMINKIKDYVKNAKESKLNSKGEHIFCIMNKCDVPKESDLPRLLNELHNLLKDELPENLPMPASALYAMKARSFLNGNIQLKDLQLDDHIKAKDSEGFPVSGRSFTEEHVEQLLVCSRIIEVEQKIGKYLEDKGNHFIYQLRDTIEYTLKNNCRQIEERINSLHNYSEFNAKDHNTKINDLSKTINILKEQATEDVSHIINIGFLGTTNDKSLLAIVDKTVDTEFPKITEKTIAIIQERWENDSKTIQGTESAMSCVSEIMDSAPNIFDNCVKEFAKELFLLLKDQILVLIENIQKKYDEITYCISEEARKEIGTEISFDTDHIFRKLTAFIDEELERIFQGTVSGPDSSELNSLVKQSYISVKVPGVKNAIKRGVGAFLDFFDVSHTVDVDSYEREFSVYKFKASMEEYFNKFFNSIRDSNTVNQEDFHNNIINTINGIKKEFDRQNTTLINQEVELLQNLLGKMKVDHEQSEADVAKELHKLNQDKNNIMMMQVELSKLLPKKGVK